MLLIWFSKLRSGSKMTLRFFTFGLTCRVRFPSLFIISSLWVSVPMIRTSVLSLFNSSTAQYWRSSLAEVVGYPYCQVLQINTSGCHQHNSENESCSHGSFLQAGSCIGKTTTDQGSSPEEHHRECFASWKHRHQDLQSNFCLWGRY